LLGELLVCPFWLFSDFCPVFFSNIFIDFDWPATAGMSVLPISLRSGNPVTLMGFDIVVVRTGVRTTLLKLVVLVLKGLSSLVESDATNSSRTTVIMPTCVGF